MNWKIKQINEGYLVYAEKQGSFKFNNKKDAERLCDKLNNLQNPLEGFSKKLIHKGETLIALGNELAKLGDVK